MVFNAFQENTYLLYDETNECVVIDPGCYEEDEKQELLDFIKDNHLNVTKLLNTHCHVDHVLGNEYIKQTFKVKLHMHEWEIPVLKSANVLAPAYGYYQYQESTPDVFLKENDHITFGNQSLSVLFVPGHAPGHIAFYSADGASVIAGDVLFYNSIGRTDLPGGDFQTLINSIREKLYTLPDNVAVYPGHGPKTTIGFEKKTNPFTQ